MPRSRIPQEMPAISPAAIARHRRAVLRPHRVRDRRGALRFINDLGFCFAFTGGPGGLPGLFDVLATRSTDRMWSWAWRWKDELATGRRAYYGKAIRRKPSYISLEMLPAFYALSGNTGEPDDHLQAYREGRLSLLAKTLCEAISAEGPVSTWMLRRRFVARGESGARFHRALDDLQERFLIVKAAEVEGRGGYAFIWDAFHRWMPEVVEAAGSMASEDAAAAVLERYVRIVGAASEGDIAAMFGWSPRLVGRAAARAVARCGLAPVDTDGGERWAVPGLCPG
ncbi:MAG: crosslink repair DNA glycosylase YcaQ family protein [bacterium]|nr:crosslink repair DNA glycosylase YcaQ family protein [bacterium]